MKGVLTESVHMFRANVGHNIVRERRNPLRLYLVDKLRNASPALAFSR